MSGEISIAPWVKPAATVGCFALFWSWETLHPFFDMQGGRLRHAGRNVAIAILNTVVLALLFATATVSVAEWGARNGWGLLRVAELPWGMPWLLAILLLDFWMYLWHWANHRIPLLWRFHRMHHSDSRMDVTTATRFHLGEHLIGSCLRLGLIPIFGFDVQHLLAYETLVVAVTIFHHANISLGRWDSPLRLVIVTPFMHKVHHSRWRAETDSNYSTLFSFWDRLFRSFRQREDCSAIELGLDEFDDPRWQTIVGLLQTPFVNPRPPDTVETEPRDGISPRDQES